MGKTVGIDLGTTNSVVAHLNEENDPEVIRNAVGDKKKPSVVQFRDDETVIGQAALNQSVRFRDETVRKIKREMGGDWEQEVKDNIWTPEQISALILEKLVADAADQIGDIDGAVITVPADFSVKERQATKDAAEIAGLDVERLMNEPTAACLRYGVEGDDETILVYDLGGGTFDVTVVNISEDGGIVVDGTRGGQRLGGEDFDERVYENIILPAYIEQAGEEPDDMAEDKLRSEAKKRKEELSDVETTWATHGSEFDLKITRDEFEDATEDIIENTIEIINDLFDGDNVESSKDDINRVLLVGGSSRIPAVQERVESYFGMEPSQELDQDLVVAEGAAIATDADSIDVDIDQGPDDGDEDIFTDVIARTIGVEVVGDGDQNEFEPILEQDKPVPAENHEDGFTTVDDDQISIDVKIYEGDSDFVADNDELGSFTLENIPPQPAGEPHFRIFFQIDDDGVLHAEAEDLDTGEKAETTLSIGLDQKKIDEGIQQRENIPAIK